MLRISLLGLALTLALPLSAKWYLDVKTFQQPETNVRVFLSYETLSEGEKTFDVAVNFRPENENRIFLHKEVRWTAEGADTFCLDLQLAPGRYSVDVDIADEELEVFASLSTEEIFQVSRPKDILISDIFLSPRDQLSQVFTRPFLRPLIAYDQGSICYAMQLFAQNYDALSVRAVLYRDAEVELETDHTAYTSLRQTNRVVELSPYQPSVFRDTLNLSDLPGGEYMVQVLVYEGDHFKLDEKIRFTKGGDIKQRIFNDLDTSIRMMRYVIPREQLQTLLTTEDETVKRLEFAKIWEKLYGERAEEQMERYFAKVYQANQDYGQEHLPGWLSDRGRLFIQYGVPQVRAVEIEGQRYERWVYSRWALSFLFEVDNQGYTLVE